MADGRRAGGGCFISGRVRSAGAAVGNTGLAGAPLARMDQMVVVGVFGVLTIEVKDEKALKWLQKDQQRLEDAVLLALPPAVRLVRRYAPKKTRKLRQGIIAMPGLEKSRYRGKAVAQVVIDRTMNSVFQKPSRKGHHYYYPASQEYGFRRRVRGGGKIRIEGKHYMHIASRVYESPFRARVERTVNDLLSEMD